MTRWVRSACCLALMLAALTGYAQDEEGFSGRVAFGFLSTSGNAENESLNTSFNLWWNYDPWRHELSGLAIRSSTSDVTTAEAYGLAWQSNAALTETGYIYGHAALDDDEFSSYARQLRAAVGYGRRFIDRDRHVLNAEAGVGARQADLRDGTELDEAIVRLSGDYRWSISETSTFTQALAIETGPDNTFIEAASTVSADVRENLSLVISYTIKSHSRVLPGTDKTDTFSAISLEYTF